MAERPRVLIVDDESGVRADLTELLPMFDIEVVGEAADGEEAVARARELDPDVVLMDLRMPGVDGIEATRRIREVMPFTQVVALTTYDDAGVREGAGAAGVFDFLVKGVRGSRIQEAVYAAWEHRSRLESEASAGS